MAQVAVLGGDIKEYQVLLHPERMKHYGVTLGEVMEVTRGMNQNTNGGVIYEYGNEYIVRGVVSTEEVQEMARAVIKTVEGVPAGWCLPRRCRKWLVRLSRPWEVRP